MKIPFPSLSKSFGLLPLCLVAGCSDHASADAAVEPGATPSTGSTPSTGAHRLAVKDCTQAATLFGDSMEGLKPSVTQPQAGGGLVLGCSWTNYYDQPIGVARSITVEVYLGPDIYQGQGNMTEETAQAAGMKRIPVPAFDRQGGLVVADANAFSAELPDAQVIITTAYGSDFPPERFMTDLVRADVAQKLLGL